MKKLCAIVHGFLLFFYPLRVYAEKITQAPLPDPKSEEIINYLLGEDMYQGTPRWQGNKLSTKFNYDMKKKK